MGQANAKGTGRALQQERLRAEIAVKMHMAVGGKQGHREVLQEAFRRADADGDGTIDFNEFCAAGASIGLGVSETELRMAFARFDVNRDGTVEFQEVIDFMSPPVKTHGHAQREVAVQHLERMAIAREDLDVDDAGVDRAIFRVAETVFEKELNIRKAFQTWDGNGSGSLDISEFTAALNSLGFSLDLLDAKSIFEAFDIDGDGRIKCWEFVRTLGQFEAELNGSGDDAMLPGHNTGRGGGGDPSGGTARQPVTDRIGGGGGNTMESTRGRKNESKMAQKSRLQMESENQRREEAERQARREAELEAAMADVEARRAALAQQEAALAQHNQAAAREYQMAQSQYQQHQRALLAQQQAQQQARAQAQFDDDVQAEAMRLRALMAEQQEAMQRAREQQEQAAAEAEAAAKGGKGKEVDVSGGGDLSSVLQSGLTPFSNPTSNTDVYQKAVYAWQPSSLEDSLSDAAIIAALRARLKYVHTTAAEALAQTVKEPNVAKKPHNFGDHGVDSKCLVAFASQVLYRLSEKRATDLLTAASGRAKLPIVSVPKFLELFTAAAEAAAGGAAGGKEPIKPNKVDRLSGREQKLLLTMRDYLFEQHSRMQNMFRRCDPDGNGYVTIEEFLNAMSRAGLPVGHGLDRQSNNTISEEEAANIVGFFDKDGDGHLTYAEFMTMLQATKNSVLTTKVLTQRARE